MSDPENTLTVPTEPELVRSALSGGGRITLVKTVYHQPANGSEPHMTDLRYTRDIESDEQVYKRNTKVSEEWKPLDLGWFTQAGLLLLQNEGEALLANPTLEEQQVRSSKVLELALVCNEQIVPFAQVLPGECLEFQPVDLAALRLRCRNGQVRYTLNLYPA